MDIKKRSETEGKIVYFFYCSQWIFNIAEIHLKFSLTIPINHIAFKVGRRSKGSSMVPSLIRLVIPLDI
jgi:hypothetical protein